MPKKHKPFKGRWQIVDSLGQGGQAHTFIVRDLEDGSENWVLKRLINPKRRERFQREVEALVRLRSDHVPRIVDHSLDGTPFLVTRYAGRDLTKVSRETLEPARMLLMLRQVVTATLDAHRQGIVHRDIKPNNVTIDDAGNVFLIDFGICADDADGSVLTTTTEGLGNRNFAAPECEAGSVYAPTPASDIYSIGKLLAWMASKGQCFPREYFSEDILRVGSRAERSYLGLIVRHCVKEDAGERLTAEQLLDDIDWILAKLAEHEVMSREGLHVVDDRFGPDDEWSSKTSKSTSTRPFGNPPLDHSLAESFVTEEDPLLLARVDLALRSDAGDGRIDVNLVEDEGGLPSEKVLERWEVIVPSALIRGNSYKLLSHSSVHLHPGRNYWVTISARDVGSSVAWLSAPPRLCPRPVRFAERDYPRAWQSQASSIGPGLALRVLAKLVR